MMRKILRWLCVKDETRLMIILLMVASCMFGHIYGTTDKLMPALLFCSGFVLTGAILNVLIQIFVNRSED